MENGMFARILVATDSSTSAGSAARIAASIAHASSAEVKVVHVWDVETMGEAEDLLANMVEELRAEGVNADGELVRADEKHVATALTEYARDYGADLVVLGSRGLSDWQSIVKHSVSHHLLANLDCAVLVVRGSRPQTQHDDQRVLLAIAGGADIEPAVRAATAAASAPGSKVLVVHVRQEYFGAHGLAYVEPLEEVHESLARATKMLKRAGIATEAFAAGPGRVADVLAETATRWQADVIVLGSSRMGDLESIALGSVTHDLLRATDRPVLVAERTG